MFGHRSCPRWDTNVRQPTKQPRWRIGSSFGRSGSIRKTSVRRLNRAEYGNTVSDLMGIRFDAAILFPPDDSGFGFDNIGDALSFSPLLMEKYLHAAQQIVDQAIPKTTWVMPAQEFHGRDFRDNAANINGDGLSSTKPVNVKCKVMIDTAGKYKV
ncbi:MAG: DUF1587 domain-containing protein, partial [Planctomycetota bacterium]|nr:DUF1587 domain-containing protein [Planctomycetota bacterium]